MLTTAPSANIICPNCGKAIPSASPEGLCPRCLAAGATDTLFSLPANVEDLSERRFFGDFELLEELGRGGSGIVFKARQLGVNRIVALKLLVGGAAATRDFVHRFHTEAAAAAQLEHPNIVPVYEFGEHEGAHYLAMRHLEGGTLQALIVWKLPTAREAVRLLLAVTLAIEHAHRRGILHRDLKPANILLDAENTPYVSDFGLARVLEHESSLTLTHAVLGTISYLAPETATSGAAASTTASDIYGLGAILFELLIGRPPFAEPTIPATLRAIVEKAPSFNSEIRNQKSELPLDLKTICLKCLEKDPLKRYPAAQALADDLQHFLNNEPISARPITRAAKIIRWSQRNPALATAYSLLTLILILILICSPVSIFRINEARKAEAAARLRAEAESYTADMNLAQRLWEEGDLLRARQHLSGHGPKSGVRDLRGFEWRYLWHLCRDESRRSLTNFDGPVRFTWMPDRRLVAVTSGKAVKCFSPDGDTPETNLISDAADDLSSLAFSPTSTNLFATGCDNGTVQLWDLSTKRPLALFSELSDHVSTLAFSPDGHYLAGAAQNEKKIALWDVPRRTNLWFRPTSVPSLTVIFSLDGRSLISGGGPDAGNALVWDLDGNVTSSFPGENKGWTSTLIFSPDGRLLATGSADSTTILWDVTTRKPLRRINGYGGAAFSPDGQRLALGDGTGTIALWDLSTGERLARFRGHERHINDIAFAPDGHSFLSASDDDTLKVWDLHPRPVLDTIAGHSNWIAHIEFSPDGKLLASLHYHQPFFTRLWDVQSWTPITDLLGPTDLALGLCFSPDGSMLAMGSADRMVHIWNPATHALRMILTNDFRAAALAFSRDNQFLGVTDGGWIARGKDLCFWEIPSTNRIRKLEAYQTNATAIAFAHQNDLLAVGYYDGTVRLWDFPRERLLCEFHEHSELVWSLAFNADDSLLASGSNDHTAALYDLRSRSAFPLLRDHTGFVWSVAFSRDGRTLATASHDSTIKLWSLAALKPALTLKGHLGAASSVSFTPDDQLLATSGADGMIRFWPAVSIDELSRSP